MTDPVIYDIVIIGGGLVGASLASALRATSLRIALIEAAPWFTERCPPSYDDRVLVLSYSSQRIFSGIGIWEQIAPVATPIKQIHVSDQGHFGFTRLNSQPDLGTTAFGYVVTARHLGQVLQTTLNASPIEIWAPAQVIQTQYDQQLIAVQVKQDEQIQTLTTSLLVVADGGRSPVRQQLGITSHEFDYQQTAIIANVTPSIPHQQIAYERFTASGPLAMLPLLDNHCSLVWTRTPEQAKTMMAWNNSTFLAALQQEFGWRLGQFQHVGQRHAYPLRLVRAQPLTRSRAVVIGNAAHTLHPVAGQGFNLGLRDVASLAETVVNSWRNHEDIGSAATLQRYVAWQQPDHQGIINLTDQLIKVFANTLPPLVIMRNLGLLMIDSLPPARKQFVRQMAGMKSYPSRLIRGLSNV
jgi:2-octaprenyl-6-methoxyphenol hydroxylase